jgi:hypothetical protein
MSRIAISVVAAALAIGWGATPGNTTAAASTDWQSETFFRIDPNQIPGFSEEATTAVYRLLDPEGSQVGPTIRRPALQPLNLIEVPPVPGIYTIEGWLEGDSGPLGPPRVATLRFDDSVPSPATPEAAGRWLLGTEAAVLRIGRPPLPYPLSGIRGYAISLDRGSGATPCSRANWCGLEETDLTGGIEDDEITLGTLPEGANYARVVSVSGSGVASTVATAVFRVDATRPRVSLRGVPPGWSAGPVRVLAHASDDLSGMGAAGASGPFTAVAVDGAAPTATPGDESAAWVAGSGVHRIEAYARDEAGNLSGGDLGGPAAATAAVRIDEEPPQVLFAPAQDPAEPERLEATVGDTLSGVDSSRGSIKARLAGTQARFEHLPTELIGDRLVARWDSDFYPPGKYEFVAVGFDAAGNEGIGTTRDRGGRMVLLNPLKTPVAIAIGSVGPRLVGRLRTLDGAPVSGEQVAVVETFAEGSESRRRVTGARTGEDGSFIVRLLPGPNRDVVARFAGTRLLTRAWSATRPLAVPAGVRLRASATEARVGGRPVVFSGRVGHIGAARAVRRLPVELQFRYPGARWSEFRTVETDARGRFRYTYRFSDDDSRGVRFQFRAYVTDREGWPYDPGASRPVSVLGR